MPADPIGSGQSNTSYAWCGVYAKRILRMSNSQFLRQIGPELLWISDNAQTALGGISDLHDSLDGLGITLTSAVNIGDVIPDGGDVYGAAVNQAARIKGILEPGEVCFSGEAYDTLPTYYQAGFRFIGQHSFKGVSGQTRLYLQAPREEEDETMNFESASVDISLRHSKMSISTTTDSVELIDGGPTLRIGRHSSNDLRWPSPNVSKFHGTAEPVGGKFIYLDQSTFGTFVFFNNSSRHFVHRDKVILMGSGFLATRPDAAPSDEDVLHFHQQD
ncbi:MAG: FHA domain-containing protein [Magnetovibrionaceae bacterium]